MSELMEYTQYLSKAIGPRPAGTEEEHQAALYITEQFQKETGFSASIEEFKQATRPALSSVVLTSAAALLSVVALFFSVIVIPLFIVVALLAATYVLEISGYPLLSRLLAHGRSQNVIAKYQPNTGSGESSRSITRKIIVVAHYDSGHALPPLVKRLNSFKISFDVLCAYVMIALAVLMFIRIFVAIIGGGMLVILNTLTVVAALAALLPLVEFALVNNAPYNEGANNNATGVAALIELAARISRGSVSEADLAEHAENVVIHGAAAAQDEGLVPEDATLSYEAATTEATSAHDLSQEQDREDAQSEEERLLAAKAAVAALTGRPVERRIYAQAYEDEQDASQAAAQLGETVQMDMQEFMTHENGTGDKTAATMADGEQTSSPEDLGTSGHSADTDSDLVGMAPDSAFPKSAEPLIAQTATAAAAFSTEKAPEDTVAGFQNAPSWFVAAQKNAKRPTNAPTEIHRSRYTEALEHAEQERLEQEQALRAEEEARLEAERQQREAEAHRALEAQAVKAAAEQAKASLAPSEQEEVPEDAARAEAQGAEVVAHATQEGAVAPAGQQASSQGRTNAAAGEESAASLPRYVDDASVTRVATSVTEVATTNSDASEETATATAAEIFETSTATSTAEGETVSSRVERLKSLRTSIPSLSGIIRSKDAARKTAAASVPNPLDAPSTPAPAAPDKQAPTTSHASSETAAASAETPVETPTSPAAESPRDAASEHAAAQVSARNSVRASRMVVPEVEHTTSTGFTGSFAAASERDFAADLLDEADNAKRETESDESQGASRYGDHNNAFLDDEDFDKVARKKRKGIFDRFRRSKGDEDAMSSPQQWLGVDENFEARSAGRARGSWESFRQESDDDITDPFKDDGYDDFGELDSEVSPRRRGRHWEGGSYSRVSLGRVDNRSGEDAAADETVPDASPETKQDRFITGEIERIYHFRNPSFNSEIWFVAMGCDNESHEGVRAFLNEHRSELRGSMVIELESLGAGELSVASHEGALKKVSASTRIKRYTREAVAATGIPLHEVDLSGTDSIASIIQVAGFQSMHLFGAEKGQIALKGSASDTLENVNEAKLEENIRFIYELLKR